MCVCVCALIFMFRYLFRLSVRFNPVSIHNYFQGNFS